MNLIDSVAVCSRSFSKNEVLRNELLSRYKHVKFNDEGIQLKGQALVNFLRGSSKAIIALEEIDEHTLLQLPELKVLSKYGVGLDSIDLMAMSKLDKKLGWTSGVNRRSVSELVLAFAISLLRKVHQSNREVVTGIWKQTSGGLLSGRKVGIIGCGNIGKDLVELLKPFGCEIFVHDIVEYTDFYRFNSIVPVSLEELFEICDVISVHVPLNDSTRGMVTREHLSLMKSSAVLINTARGGLVDEGALAETLSNNKISGAAFDVFLYEPPRDLRLLSQPNFLCTPHIGGSAEEAILAMGMAAIIGLDENSIPNEEHNF